MDPGAGPDSSLTVNEQVSSGAGRGGGVRVMDQGGKLHRAPRLFLTRNTRPDRHFTYPDVVVSWDFSGAGFGDLSCDFKK